MGCKSSKEQQETKNIEYNFTEIGIEKYDNLWKECLEQMKQLEKIRLEIELLVVNIQLLCNSFLLQRPQLIDNLNLLMWTLVSRNGGTMDEIEVNVSNKQSPYLSTKTQPMLMNSQMQEFKYTYEQLMLNIYVNKPQYDQLCQKVQRINQTIQQSTVRIKQETQQMDNQKQVEIMRKQQMNQQIYRTSITKIVSYQKEFEQMKQEMDEVVKQFNQSSHKQQVLVKGQAMVQKRFTELGQAIQVHDSNKLTQLEGDAKKSEMEYKYSELQNQFNSISTINQIKKEKQIEKQTDNKQQETNKYEIWKDKEQKEQKEQKQSLQDFIQQQRFQKQKEEEEILNNVSEKKQINEGVLSRNVQKSQVSQFNQEGQDMDCEEENIYKLQEQQSQPVINQQEGMMNIEQEDIHQYE